MSVDQLPPGKARPAKSGAQFVRYEEFIDRQIESTRRTVKIVDVLTALLTIVVGTMAFLLVAAVVEHWLLPGGFNVAVRLLLFALLFTCLTFYSTRKLWPLVRGSINPAYAAQAIEQDNPSLKNSLLNLLLFRQHRDDVTDAVYETLEEQAATRLHRVPIEAAVDRTNLLRLGYALIGILAVVALYKILSPKDPFASAERVLMPWARIAAPSRVSIENIAPGHVTLSRGESLKVAADVRGIGEDDPVVVKFTTADGQAVDRPAAMKPDAAGLRFQGSIPPEGDAALGVAQDLRYYIEAGDARSLEYKVTVISAPTITVERVDYDYPDYTGFADRSIERLGDIRAIEGTRVTIHARANQSIDEAAIDFQADGRRDVSLTAEGEQARATFTLEMRDDRETAKFTSYVLRFTGSDGRPNRDPVKHPIDVLPDYLPEAAILAPKEKTRDVRLDETVAIEIEARDPDFALADVRLTGESAGRTILNKQLLAKSHNGRFVGRLTFTPGEHELHAGDVVRYWVTARDNRAPQANEATTDSQTFRIVGPDPRQPGQPPQDRIAQREQPGQPEQQQNGEQQKEQGQQGDQQDQQQGQDQSSQGEQGESGGESSDSSRSGEQGEGQESGESSSSEGNSGENGEQGSANQSSENGQGENSQNQSGEQQSGGQSGGEGESSASEQGGEAGQAQQRPGGKQETGQGSQSGDPQQGSQDGAQSDAQSSQESGQGSQNNSQNGGEDVPARESGESSPVSSEGDNDGEAFERIQDFLKDQGQLPKESQHQQGENQQSNGEQGSQEQGQQEKQPGESSDGQTSEGQSSEGQSKSGKSESADNKQQPEQGQDGDDSQGANASSGENGESQSGESQPGSESSQPKNEQTGTESAAGESGEKTKEPSGASDRQQPGGGQKTQGEGESGAGNQAEQGKAPPDSSNAKSNEKWQQDPSGDSQGEQQQQSDAGRGERQSDSHGEQGGEQTGAAEENKSQKSERDGTGSSGQNQSSDEGMGESSEKGAGRNSSSGGQDAQANERTGQSSENKQGEGSQQREGQGSESGGKPGDQQGQQGESQSGEQGKKQQGKQPGEQGQPGEQQDPSQSGEQARGGEQGEKGGSDVGEDAPARDGENKPSNEQQGGQRSGTSATDGAGRVPEGVMQPSGGTGDAPDADAANLEFARKQTDLVLETLADQMKRQKVDKRLLDKLGWTEADMKRFVERWQQLKAAADANNPDANEAQRELDDALRSLGLRRGELQQSTVTDDKNRNLRQGYRGAVPLEYQEHLRAYNQGVSRARQDAE